MTSSPEALSARVYDHLVASLALTVAEDIALTSPMSPEPVGHLRVLRGSTIDKLVNVDLIVPAIGLDSRMLFVFTPPQSAVPHFTLDAVARPDRHAMHLDLVPRADLAVNLAYLDAAFLPLTPLLEEAWKIDGVSPAQVGPRQRAMMSPWMVVCRATDEAFRALDPTVDSYLEHFLSLLDKGVPDVTGDTAERDRVNRANLFNPDVDPVWGQVNRLLGDEQTERVRGELLS